MLTRSRKANNDVHESPLDLLTGKLQYSKKHAQWAKDVLEIINHDLEVEFVRTINFRTVR
jgi:hypothetical protein